MRKIILASVSPWRKKILTEAGIPFAVEESGYVEDMSIPLAPRVLARRLALGKAEAVAKRHKDAVVIGADTFAVFRGRLLGKPHTLARATEILMMLSGKTHTLLTGFAIVDSKTGRHVSKTVATRVTFRTLSQAEISAYVKTGEPLKAAGAYVIQGKGARLIQKTTGDRNNIAGLPLAAVLEALGKFGVGV
ncbi:septum formation protein Maf [Candidatus Kaiserbacteria bacterium]|nr:septum formation protein Maf [Candidatus Kaiserbacteria bacterium]